jgi:hypothetical protein
MERLSFQGNVEINKSIGYEVKIQSPLLPNSIKIFIKEEETHCSIPETESAGVFELDEILYNSNRMVFVCRYISDELSKEFVKTYQVGHNDYFDMDNNPRVVSETHFGLSLQEYFDEFISESNLEVIMENGVLEED